MAWQDRRPTEPVEGGDDARPADPTSHKTALRHSRIAMAGGALAVLSFVWLCSAQYLFNKLASSALGAAVGTMACGWAPAIIIWSVGLALSTIGLVLAVRRRVRAAIPIVAISLCALVFAWANWPTAEDLVVAAIKGDAARVNRCLWLGVDINRPRRVRGGFGPPDTWKEAETALTAAVIYDQTDMVHFLLDHGADVNQTDGDGRTALVTAVRSGRPELIELLISRGATLSIEDPETSKSLMVQLGRSWGPVDPLRLSRTVEILIRHDANLEPVEIHDWAMQHWEPSLARRLAEARLERPHPVNPRTDLRNLIALGDDDGAAALLGEQTELLTAESWRNDRYRMLDHAARFNCPQVVALLWDHLPPPAPHLNQASRHPPGAHALHQAAAEGHLAIVRMLLDRGLPVDCRDSLSGSDSPLDEAVRCGHLDVACLLVERGADVNFGFQPRRGSDTPIFLAAQQGDMAMVEMLLKAGARVDIHGFNGRTPLDCAANAGHVSIAQVLLDHGAFPSQLAYPVGERTLQQAGLSPQEIKKLTQRPASP